MFDHLNARELHCAIVHHPDDLPTTQAIERGIEHIDSLYAIGFEIDARWVLTAYQRGLFPWYNEGEPVLWHSPDPRMVLDVNHFVQSHSLSKKLKQWARQPDLGYRVTLNQAFTQVITSCAHTQRDGQNGTWINPQLASAYIELHQQQHAYSIEVWQHEQLIAGLYGVIIGRMIFGESMFTTVNDGSKIALACWIQHLKSLGAHWIDCQQVTAHLSRLGAHPVSRSQYLKHSSELMSKPIIDPAHLCSRPNLLAYFLPNT
jgi:leucyl/phenylalanyl-tRNA---protein transferase